MIRRTCPSALTTNLHRVSTWRTFVVNALGRRAEDPPPQALS
ncbi:hypothetical protein [Alloactinosynnema sp. L-07]|nr:hypothetical protein [Alloactinosynnema sp. L-07]